MSQSGEGGMESVEMKIRLLAIALLVASAGTAWGQGELTSLTMIERAGVDREDEWVTIGVPLPKGRVRSADELALLRDDRPIEAEIIPVTRWWEDETLRWVHLIFPTGCLARSETAVTLAHRKGASIPEDGIFVSEKPNRFIVDIGSACFEVRKDRFNVIDTARLDGEMVIDSHERGLGVRVGRQEYLAFLDPNVAVTLEEKGSLHAVIRAVGSFCNSNEQRRFDFDCRIHAYARCPYVDITVTLINRQGQESDCIALAGFFLELPTDLKKASCTFGTQEGRAIHGSLAGEPEAYVYQRSASQHVFGGAVTGVGGGKQIKPQTIGWAGLSDRTRGIAAGIKWFWQMHPKSVELYANGLIHLGLYPSRHPKPLDVYTGVARTHELRLFFHSGRADDERLHGVFAGLQQPLRAFAPPKWYCRETQALGDYCEAGGSELYGDFAAAVAKFDAAFEQANRRCQSFRDGRTIKGVKTDSYGFLGYGDGVHHVWTVGIDVPRNLAWAGNYYGYPHMMCTQFLRTGDREYFDNFEAHALYVADVHTVHYTPRTHLIGGCRYCPPTDHVRIDPTDWNDYRTASVYVSDLFNHHKVAGVLDRWYFLRDHRSRDVASKVLDYCYQWRYGDNDYGQPRGPGMIMDFCYHGYIFTGEKRWIERAAHVLHVHKGRDLKLSFQAGIFLEGLRRYYEISGDEQALEYIRQSCDRLIAQGKGGGVTAQAHSFMYRKTGEQKYLRAALDNLPWSGQFGNPWKDYALSMRNAAMCIGDLHHVSQQPASDSELSQQ